MAGSPYPAFFRRDAEVAPYILIIKNFLLVVCSIVNFFLGVVPYFGVLFFLYCRVDYVEFVRRHQINADGG